MLLEEVDPDELLPHLITKGVFTIKQHAVIDREQDVEQRVKSFLRLLDRKATTAFPSFVDSLRDTGREDVASTLMNDVEKLESMSKL